jgi:hypothetical protein
MLIQFHYICVTNKLILIIINVLILSYLTVYSLILSTVKN